MLPPTRLLRRGRDLASPLTPTPLSQAAPCALTLTPPPPPAGVVYVTDETSRHEVTSWRLDASAPPPAVVYEGGGSAHHTVLVVDSSGSMRLDDVPGYSSRTEAVYTSIVRELVQPQLELSAAGGARDAVVSLLEFSDEACVLLRRGPIDADLKSLLQSRATSRAASHGNYLPALDALTQLLREDAVGDAALLVVFLSDGAPSDHVALACECGVHVWQSDYSGRVFASRGRTRAVLNACDSTRECRAALRASVRDDCVRRVRESWATSWAATGCGCTPSRSARQGARRPAPQVGRHVGPPPRRARRRSPPPFPPVLSPRESYEVLQAMASVLPQSSFQKLGLAAANLRTAFTQPQHHAGDDAHGGGRRYRAGPAHGAGAWISWPSASWRAPSPKFNNNDGAVSEAAAGRHRGGRGGGGRRGAGRGARFGPVPGLFPLHLVRHRRRPVGLRPAGARACGCPNEPPPKPDPPAPAHSLCPPRLISSAPATAPLQGVWNAVDGFLLTDPAMHRRPMDGRQRRGATDKGTEGVRRFFATHKCGSLCARLGLKPFSPAPAPRGGRQ